MIRMIAKLSIVTLVLTAFLSVAPASAGPLGPFAWVSSAANANDANACTVAQPCQTTFRALAAAGTSGQVNCIDSPGINEGNNNITQSATIDCAGMITGFGGGLSPEILAFSATNQVFKVRNLTFNGFNSINIGIKVTGSGTLIFENCVFENFSGNALDIEPNGPLTLVITNSRISNNTAAGVLIKPAAGGSVTASFDGATITKNAGGLKTDTTNGAVRVDITNSAISNNANNGLIAIGGAGGQNMVTVKNDVIASNSQAGIEASGGNAAVLVNNAVIDSNTGGALQAVSSGRILTYQNNTVIGALGTGFSGTAAPQ
jgi:hypothetical protein